MPKLTEATIIAVEGPEPPRENEYAWYYRVGAKPIVGQTAYGPVTKIEHRVDHRGDHGIGWYDVHFEEGQVVSFNERHVGAVERAPASEDDA